MRRLEKENPEKPAKEEKREVAKKARHPVRKFFKYFFLLFFLFLAAAIGGIVWLCQSESGQNLLIAEANKAMAPQFPGQAGLHFKITGIRGSLPFNFSFGLEAYDAKGLWLRAPDNRIALDWPELPGALRLAQLRSFDPDLLRLPEIPPDNSPPPPPSPPMTLADVRELLAKAADFLDKEHWWMPAIRIEKVGLVNALLPAGLMPTGKPETDNQRMRLNAVIDLDFVKNETLLKANASLAGENDKPIYLPAFQFDNLNFNLRLTAGPAKNAAGITANGVVGTFMEKPRVLVEGIPADFLKPETSLVLNLNADARTDAQNPGISVSLSGPKLDAGHGKVNLDASWSTADGWKRGELDGEAKLKLSAEVDPVAGNETGPLAILQAPAAIILDVSGNLPKLDLNFKASCADLREGGHTIKDLALNILSKEFIVPLNGDISGLLQRENTINLALAAEADSEPVRLTAAAAFQAMADKQGRQEGWKVGLKDLRMSALGITGGGNADVLLPEGQMPRANGKIDLKISHWQGIEKFVPEQKFSGEAAIDINLASATGAVPHSATLTAPQEKAPVQNAHVSINIPAFGMHDATGSGVDIKNLRGDIKIKDIFANPGIDANLDALKILVAGMDIGAKVKASGLIAGPLEAEVSSTGSVVSTIAAQWTPGKAELKTLNVAMAVPGKDKGGKVNLGIRSRRAAEIEYGESGIHVRNLELDITPSGRLRANGGLAPDKLDFSLDLENLLFKPWQALAPQIPLGSASMRARLTGTPKRPGGDFRLSLDKVALPAKQVPPISMVLAGKIEDSGRQSALNARLDIDPATLKLFGAETAEVSARLPLVFEANGVPKPDMTGPLRAIVRWDGAIGPIWNLLPIADRRLNGRLNININADGSLKAPAINGGVRVEKGRFEDLELGVLLTDINMRVDLSGAGKSAHGLPGGMTLALNLSDGRGGTVSVNGKGALNGSDLDVKAKIDHLKPLRRRDVHVELSGQAQVSGEATAPVVTGEVIVNKGDVLLNNLAFSGSVTTLPITTPEQLAALEKAQKEKIRKEKAQKTGQARKAEAEAGTQKGGGAGSLNVRIVMPPRFTVEGRGLTSTWQANLLVGGTPANPQITGNVSVVKGTFDFLGKIFTFTRGTVTFAGGSISDPLLDIELTNETPDLVAHILVTGAVSSMKLSLSSDPSMPRDEIISHVLFGRSVNELSRMEALQLAAAVAELAGFGGGSGILNFAKKTLGVDVLRIGSSSGSSTGDTGDPTGGATVEMGKYINDMIYMGVQQGMKPDSTAFIIQMELTPRTSLEVRTEQNNTWGGIKWKYNY